MLAVASAALLLVVRDVGAPDAAAPDRSRPTLGSAVLSALALGWLRDSTVEGTRLAVPPELRDRVAAALPGRDVREYSPRVETDLVLVPTGSEASAVEARRLVARSFPVAAVSPDFELRQVMAPGRSWARELAARTAAGRELVQNDALVFTARAKAALRAGHVDPRLLTVFAGLALEHRVAVDVPPSPVSTGADSVRLTATILRVDGKRMSDYPWGAANVKAFLTVQSPSFTPVAVERRGARPGVLAVHYALPSPTGLLDGAVFTTSR